MSCVQRVRPVAASIATTSPSRDAAKIVPPSSLESEREAQFLATAAHARVPQFLDVERGLEVDQFGRRLDAFLVLVAPGHERQQARCADGCDPCRGARIHGVAPAAGVVAAAAGAGVADRSSRGQRIALQLDELAVDRLALRRRGRGGQRRVVRLACARNVALGCEHVAARIVEQRSEGARMGVIEQLERVVVLALLGEHPREPRRARSGAVQDRATCRPRCAGDCRPGPNRRSRRRSARAQGRTGRRTGTSDAASRSSSAFFTASSLLFLPSSSSVAT